MTPPTSSYDKTPFVAVEHDGARCWRGWETVMGEIRRQVAGLDSAVVAIDCYSGVHEHEIREAVCAYLRPSAIFSTAEAALPPQCLESVLQPYLGGDDPIFGYLCPFALPDLMDPGKAERLAARVLLAQGLTVVIGPGASLFGSPNILVYADMPRWEGQLRQRRGEVPNLWVENAGAHAGRQYKRSFFVDWRVLDRHKQDTIDRWDYVLDSTRPGEPRMIDGDTMRRGLDAAARRPFRLVPFFDPGPWGGQWLKKALDLDPEAPNFAWGFDCVPEENSLNLKVEGEIVELPSVNLLYYRPTELLGRDVHSIFGEEFPIRFDLLDTMGGGNLSLQVHPTVDYIRRTFGAFYTQDESYYILDAEPDGVVYLGLREDADVDRMLADLRQAQTTGEFDPTEYVSQWPAHKHDHFLIPGGTIHCSGANTMVLEISATPYIFTFKLWDWGRLGLDGVPRPINVGHGEQVLARDRRESWVRSNLVNQSVRIGVDDGSIEERTGLHALEFIETRRHWFTKPVTHRATRSVNVLNLVEGDSAVVSSPTGLFDPFEVHYAETFVVPAAAGDYVISPGTQGARCATLKAFVDPMRARAQLLDSRE